MSEKMADALEIAVSSELAQQIREHGVQTYPDECCGALLGKDGAAAGNSGVSREVLSLFPLINRRDDSPRNRFSITAEDVREAEESARAQGLDVIGWYHSHPDHPARPSEYDRDHAWPWYSYVIVSVHGGTPKDMTSWRLQDDRSAFLQERIEGAKASVAS